MTKEQERIHKEIKGKPKSEMTKNFEKIWDNLSDPVYKANRKLLKYRQSRMDGIKKDLGI